MPAENIYKHDGDEWESLGVVPVLRRGGSSGVSSLIADAIRQKLGVINEGTGFCTIGILRSLGNACVGVTP